jgi:hypothetical protein
LRLQWQCLIVAEKFLHRIKGLISVWLNSGLSNMGLGKYTRKGIVLVEADSADYYQYSGSACAHVIRHGN